MQGLTSASLKKHYALIPLFASCGLGVLGATFYTIRLATKNPDVSWNKKKNPLPNQEYENKQYKFVSSIDYSTYKTPAPKYMD